ncbi:MAG: hypothetical protein A3K60_04615 [Euryarchaeota archaeon RBG_19FT_COMBO_56_21]|nr:MAG: hypothetical protein A3K60_04615 [Euryarchaeota archaeon RBG_19FT_COMBO_56_21]
MKALREQAHELVEVARAAGADDVICEVIESGVHQVRFSNSEIDAVNCWNESHAVLFVALGKRTLVSDLRDLSRGRQMAKELVSNAAKAPEIKGYGGIGAGKFKYSTKKADKKIAQLREPSKFVLDAISGAESAGANNVGGTMCVRHRRTGVASSGGAFATDELASMDLSVRAFSQPEASGHSVCCASKLVDMKARETGVRAGDLSVKAKNPVLGEEGRFDIVVEPLFIGSLMHYTQNMLSAMWVDIGRSMYAKRLGKPVASKAVTLVDDPTMDSISRRAFDHEGVPTKRNVLIKNGTLKTYMHNTSTAKRFKARSTSNAGPLIPTLFTLMGQPVAFHPVVEKGDWSSDEIVSDTKNGLYLNNTWYTRFQSYAAGDFSTIPRDAILRIKDGEIVGAVKNIRISDNMMNFWKSVDALSKSTEEVYWWDEASPPSTLPLLRASSMNVTRSS